MANAELPSEDTRRQTEPLRRGGLWRRVAGHPSGLIGALLAAAIVVLAFAGPFFAPYSPTEIAGIPYQGPSAEHWLGMDALGRDAFSRFLSGGMTVVIVAFTSTALAYLCGITIGLIAGLRRGMIDLISVVVIDLVLAVPPIVVVLVLLAAVGPRLWLIIVAIGGVFTPRIARLVRSVALEISTQDFVEAAVARGERIYSILYRDVFMNALLPISADVGIRLSGAIILFSSLSYLGLGEPPPAPEWGAMISENRAGVTIQPWVLVVPAATIALLAIGVNLLADSVARATGRSVVGRDL